MNNIEKLLQMMKTFEAIMKNSGTYESRKVGLDTVNGLEVSTVYSSDEGYETAIIDTEKIYCVERYNTLELAEEGHKKWMKEAETMEELLELEGIGGMIPSRVIINLKRKS